MKKQVKIIGAVIIIAALLAGTAYYFLQPTEYETVAVTQGKMQESLQLKGTLAAAREITVNATTTGVITKLAYETGDTVQTGEQLAIVDDSAYQDQISDQIKTLEKEKAAVFTQGVSGGTEIKLRQQQLIDQMDSLRHEYELQFGDGGTAALDVKAAKAAMEGARSDCDTALDANDKAGDAGQSAPYSGTALGSLHYAYESAKVNYQKALLMNTDSNKEYYQSLLKAYEAEFETLTENGDNNAASVNLAAAQIQVSINSLKREQSKEDITADIDGIVSQVLVEEGSYVTENQPIMNLYQNGDYTLETWMLTEDAMSYNKGDAVEILLPDGSLIPGEISDISTLAQQRLSSLGVEENRCKVEISASNLPQRMGPGYQLDVVFRQVKRENALSIPVSALATENGKSVVYKLIDGKKVTAEVTTGIYSGGMVEITEGVSESDTLIVGAK